MSGQMRTITARPVPGRWTRSVPMGGFPAAPEAGWTAGQVTRWREVRDFSAAYPGNAAGGWTVESAGVRPGAVRLLACWAASPVAALGTLAGALQVGVPLAPAVFAGTGAAGWLVVQGARIVVRADARAEARMRAQSQAAEACATAAAAASASAYFVDADGGDQELGGLARVIPLHGHTQDQGEAVLAAAQTPPVPGRGPRGGWRR